MTTDHFDEETWAYLDALLAQLPAPVLLRLWGDPAGSWAEGEAAALVEALVGRYSQLSYQLLPRRDNYSYYPVIGIFRPAGTAADEPEDPGLRIIGLPQGYQLTALAGAIQAVAFRGQQLEPLTRIQLSRLPAEVDIQLLTAAEDETGVSMAAMLFGMAAASPRVRTFLVMTDMFPEVAQRYSARYLPHTVLNGRVHVDGVVDENGMLKQLALAVR